MRTLYAVGCERSGNTMLARLLRRHPDLLVLAEVKVLQTVMMRHAEDLIPHDRASSARLWDGVRAVLEQSPYASFDSPWNRETKALLAAAADRAAQRPGLPGLRDFVAEVRAGAAATGARALVHAEPSLVYFLPELELLCPGEHAYVHVLRDGIAVANSIDKVPTMPSGTFAPAMRWKRAVRAWAAFERAFPAASTHEVRYEDLIHPDRYGPAMRALCAFLGVAPREDRTLSPDMSRENFERTGSAIPEPQPTPLTIDVAAAHCLLADGLRRLGYARRAPALPAADQVALKRRELAYWHEVRDHVAQGARAFR